MPRPPPAALAEQTADIRPAHDHWGVMIKQMAFVKP
jgi:hypothetical protein